MFCATITPIRCNRWRFKPPNKAAINSKYISFVCISYSLNFGVDLQIIFYFLRYRLHLNWMPRPIRHISNPKPISDRRWFWFYKFNQFFRLRYYLPTLFKLENPKVKNQHFSPLLRIFPVIFSAYPIVLFLCDHSLLNS